MNAMSAYTATAIPANPAMNHGHIVWTRDGKRNAANEATDHMVAAATRLHATMSARNAAPLTSGFTG